MTTTILPQAPRSRASTAKPRSPHDTPRISAAHRRTPEIVGSRQEAYDKLCDAIRKAVPDYSPEELDARASAWTDAAIKKGAIIIENAS